VLQRTAVRSKATGSEVGVKLVDRADHGASAKVESDDLETSETLQQRRRIAHQHQHSVLQTEPD